MEEGEEEEDLVLEILKHDKIWGTICISVSYSKLLGGLDPLRFTLLYKRKRWCK